MTSQSRFGLDPHRNQALDPHLPCTLAAKEAQVADPVEFVVKIKEKAVFEQCSVWQLWLAASLQHAA